MVRDASAALALAPSGVLECLRASAAAAELAGVRLVATDALDASGAEEWRRPRALAPDSLAFLQYTSGSTAA